jgi:DNA-binding response OmpR family regulator
MAGSFHRHGWAGTIRVPPNTTMDDGAQIRVLIVDDDAAVRELLMTLLRFEGVEVAAVEDGEAALEAVAAERPDVVLVDVQLPGLDGYALCRRLKGEASSPRVVMLTGRSSAQDERDGRAAGADAYLRKPFSPVELFETLGVESDRTRP